MSEIDNTFNIINDKYKKNNDDNNNKNMTYLSEDNNDINNYLLKYKKELYIIIFFILMYIISNKIFDYNYPLIEDNLFITKIISSFRNFLKKYQRIWLFILLFSILLINHIYNYSNINTLTKYSIISILFLIILLFPYLPYSTYYKLYISIIHESFKTFDNIIK